MERLTRKTVTVLFADVVGSTALGEARDPEAVRALMGRYFERMSAVIERHGGTVEKYVGDAVMAVFGIPTAHEDDALRAVRTAAEMRVALGSLNAELPTPLSVRTGVNTGEVVTGDARTLVTGDAVNVAARLEQAATPGEILIGETTYELVRDAVVAEPVEQLELRGKAETATAWRVVAVVPDAPGHTRRFDTPLLGRDGELVLLRQLLVRAATRRSCHLVTLLGAAGVGKSRLARELASTAGRGTSVLVGRCLPYGEGITYWPLREILRSLHGVPGVGGGDLEILRAAAGDGTMVAGPDETAHALRRVVEAKARDRTLVLAFEDIHWAEPAFLDLVEHVADTVRDVPVLLLCLARPELLDERPGWGGGKLNATTLMLDPLDEEPVDALVEALAGDALDGPTRRTITEVAEGNPLFIEELVAMVIDEGVGVAVPPSVHALLTARLELLPEAERATLAAASVAGRFFSAAALTALAGEDGLAALPALERKDLVRPYEGDYRFRHMLIRDAAYESLPKAHRADLHLRLADWLDHSATAETRREADELAAWHLEQAHAARRALGIADDPLAARTFAALVRLGRAALGRGQPAEAESLLERALALPVPLDRERVRVRFDLVPVLLERGELGRAEEIVERAAVEAEALDDPVLRALAKIELLHVDFPVRPMRWVETAISTTHEALPVLEAAGDDGAIARAWLVIVIHDYVRGRIDELGESLEHALRHARRSGERYVGDLLVLAVRSLVFGPADVDTALARCDVLRAEGGDDAVIRGVSAALHAMAGRFDEARHEYQAGHALLQELGRARLLAVQRYYAAFVELLAGEAAAAERELRASARTLESIGDHGTLATVASLLATALHVQDRDEEARTWAERSRRDAPAIDLISQVQWRTALARVSPGEAVALSSEAVAIAEDTDAVTLHADALLCLRDAFEAAGRLPEAGEAAARAAALYLAKGHLVGVRAAGPVRTGGT
ncbi:MAG TPA: adenylate/guanylate cyclase domain-containing protein [Gaiellaceae bacterium]|nr:adenylate/guanylate cyclase domain-containing protein [Gaiellaceae bacterium]